MAIAKACHLRRSELREAHRDETRRLLHRSPLLRFCQMTDMTAMSSGAVAMMVERWRTAVHRRRRRPIDPSGGQGKSRGWRATRLEESDDQRMGNLRWPRMTLDGARPTSHSGRELVAICRRDRQHDANRLAAPAPWARRALGPRPPVDRRRTGTRVEGQELSADGLGPDRTTPRYSHRSPARMSRVERDFEQ